MLRFSRSYTLTILGICLAGLLAVVPNFLSPDSLKSLPSWAQSRVGLGLDLRGGAHLLLSMNTDELRKFWLDAIRDESRQVLLDKKLGFASRPQVIAGNVQVRPAKPEDSDAVVAALKERIQSVATSTFALGGVPDREISKDASGLVTVSLTEPAVIEKTSQAMAAAIEVVRRRIDALGNKEASIVREGRDRILVQVPGVADASELKTLIGQTARLSFQLLHPTMSAEEAKSSRVPTGYRILPGEQAGVSYLVDDRVIVAGEDLVSAAQGFSQTGNESVINFRFNVSGGRKFGKVTSENIGRPFAIVMDNGIINGERDIRVISAPVIRSAITGGSGEISGSFTPESANQLAIQLRSGALPASLTVIEERVVGASLGADSIEAGKRAAIIGMLGVAAFMIFAYGLFGVFAVIGAALHVVLVFAIMSMIGSTLTLPGIAGVVLTIGMAVDANVLIYERIREELRNGRSTISAIEAGFSRAYGTIIDSQLTTFIAGLLMFVLGSGPIRGFAITLTLGILTTVFTAFTVTRLLVSWWLVAQKTKKVETPLSYTMAPSA